MIDILRKNISDKNLILFDELNIPFEHLAEQNYNMYRLTKINKNKVICLKSIKEILTKKRNILHFTSSLKEVNLKVIYESTKLVQIIKK